MTKRSKGAGERTSTRKRAKGKVVEPQSPADGEATQETSPLDRMAALFGGGDTTASRVTVTAYTASESRTPPPLDATPPALRESWRCRCWSRRLEVPGGSEDAALVKSQPMNPYIYGHDHRCPLYLPTCPQCGHTSGTHVWNCSWWTDHPDQSPF